jgi:membrane protein implicated in regulation of membrane protease activity
MKDAILGFLFSPWGWLSLAAVAAGLELVVPGAYLIWLAVAALGTAITVGVLNLTIDGQLGVLVVWILIALLLSRRFRAERAGPSDDPLLNLRGARLVGETAVVSQAIDGGSGRVRLGDSEWLARGPDCGIGTRVRIMAVDGTVLAVAPIDALSAP